MSATNSIANNVYTISNQIQIASLVYYLQFCLLTTYLSHPFYEWDSKKRERESEAKKCLQREKGNHHFFPFFLFLRVAFVTLPCCSALNFVSYGLQIVEAAVSVFFLLLLRFLFSVCALLPLLINFDSLSTLQEITHPLDARSLPSHLPHSILCFFIIFPIPVSFRIRFCLPLHYVLYYCSVSSFLVTFSLSHFFSLTLSDGEGEELEAASKAACECANKWAFQIVTNKFAAIEGIAWTSSEASEMTIARERARKSEREKKGNEKITL